MCASFNDDANDSELWFGGSAADSAFFAENQLMQQSLQSYSLDPTLPAQQDPNDLFAAPDPLLLPTGLVPANDPFMGMYGGPMMRPPPNTSAPRNLDDEKVLFCDFPGCKNRGGFKRQSDLTRHFNTHGKPFKCADCHRTFGSKTDSLRHRREVHQKDENNERPEVFPCPVRGCKRNRRGFGRLWNMQTHYRKAHGGGSPPEASSPPLPPPLGTPGTLTSESEPNTPPPLFDVPDAAGGGDGDSSVVFRALVDRQDKLYRELQHIGTHMQRLKSKWAQP